MFSSIGQVREANKAIGHHWFDEGTLSFFSSRIGDTLYGDRYFVSSEQPPGRPRRYTIREAKPNGEVGTVGEFQAYATRRAAIAEAKALARQKDS